LPVLNGKSTIMQKLPNPQAMILDINNIRYTWSSILAIPSRPLLSVQTSDKKTYSEAFNLSKKTGKNISELLTPILPVSKTKESQQAIEIALYQWMLARQVQQTQPMDNINFISHLQFNEGHSLQKVMKITPTVKRNNNKIELSLPEFNPTTNVIAPSKTEFLTLKIMAVAYSISGSMKKGGYLTELTIPNSNAVIPQQDIVLPITPEEGTLMVVALALEYTILKDECLSIVDQQRWMPSEIIWAGYN
jgi:hypothetical protein